MRGWQALALGLVMAAGPAAAGDAHLPPLDPKGETILVGPGARTGPAKGGGRGRWVVKPDSVTPVRRVSPPAWFWLAADPPAGRLANGTVRARFESPGRLEATLLVRAQTRGRGRRLWSGVGLRVCGRFAWLITFEAGRVRVLGHKVMLKPPGRDAVEVVLRALGPEVVAAIYDPDSGEHLASLSAGGVSGEAGAVGLMAGCNRRRPAARLTRLAVRPACQHVPEPRGEGPPVVAWMPAAEDDRVPAGATRLEVTPDQPPVTVWRWDPAGLERLFCDGRTLLQVSTDLPWKYRDLVLLRRLGQPPARKAAGYDLAASYRDPAMVEALLRGWHERHPDLTRLEVLGRSHQGRPILGLAIGRPLSAQASRPAVLLAGGIHGDELLSTEFVLDAVAQLLDGDGPRSARWLGSLTVWCVPLINPDGLHAFIHDSVRAGRKNGRDADRDGRRGITDGVDLNRNYPFRWGSLKRGGRVDSRFYRGPRPASEPETEALIRLAERERFVASISYHMGSVILLAPYTIEGVDNPEPNEAWTVAEQVAAGLPDHPQGGRMPVRRNLYAVDGVDQDFYRHAYGTVALLVEGALWPPTQDADERARIVAAVRATWTGLLDRFLDGPSLSGQVTTADGAPVRAEIRIQEQKVQAGEIWTTRPRDGRFDRFLVAPGTYGVQVLKDGRVIQQREVKVGRERVQVDFRLPPARAN